MKKILLGCLLAVLSISFLTAQSEDFTDVDADLESMFNDAEDTDTAVVTDTSTQNHAVIMMPFSFRGHLETEFGGGWLYQKDELNRPEGYFSLYNYLYLNVFPSDDIALHGTLCLGFPKYALDFSEIYFDFRLFKSIYFSAGKKSTTWGYPRLFSQATNSTKDSDILDDSNNLGINTNILCDSKDGTTIMVRAPFRTTTTTGFANYQGSSTSPSVDDLIFAGSFEFIVFNASINLFGRAEQYTKANDNSNGPLFGLEAKRSIFGFDMYGQYMTRFLNDRQFSRVFDGDLSNVNIYRHLFTGGLYRLWNNDGPSFGFCIEYQGQYYTGSNGETLGDSRMVNCVATEIGVRRLGKDRNLKVGLETVHNFNDKTGYIKPAFIVGNAFSHCDWKNGIKWEYGEEKFGKSGKWTIGTYITLTVDY